MKMKMNLILFILIISFISLINTIPSFEVIGVSYTEVKCDYDNGFYQFTILGKGTGFTDTEPVTIILPLESPCDAICKVDSEKMHCTMDALIHDLKGEKQVKVKEEKPQFNNLDIKNWSEYFIPERRILNHATNCWKESIDDLPPKKDHHYVTFDANDLEVLGCFRDKNNFSFKLTKAIDKDGVLEEDLEDDLYFELGFEKPPKEKALCVIPKKSIKNVYTVRCAIDFDGEIFFGKQEFGTTNIEGEILEITLRGLLIPPTDLDECKKKEKP